MTRVRYRIGIAPDVEWASYPPDGLYDSRDDAIAALMRDWRWLTPDDDGARPHPWVMRATHEHAFGWGPAGCVCYGRAECAVCTGAREYLPVDEEVQP